MTNQTVTNPADKPQPFLLSAWSVTTTRAEKQAYRNLKLDSIACADTPRSRWEASIASSIRAYQTRGAA